VVRPDSAEQCFLRLCTKSSPPNLITAIDGFEEQKKRLNAQIARASPDVDADFLQRCCARTDTGQTENVNRGPTQNRRCTAKKMGRSEKRIGREGWPDAGPEEAPAQRGRKTGDCRGDETTVGGGESSGETLVGRTVAMLD
jgi:hypothetical protein